MWLCPEQPTYLPTCLEGLPLTSFHESIIIIKVHPQGCDFYNRIAATTIAAPTIHNIGSLLLLLYPLHQPFHILLIHPSSPSSASSSSSHEGSMVVQQSAVIVTQIECSPSNSSGNCLLYNIHYQRKVQRKATSLSRHRLVGNCRTR